MQFLEDYYPSVPFSEIDSLFGFVEKSTLYGGRQFVGPELSDLDISELYRHDIGFRMPLTNHYVEQIEYELNAPLLDKYHRTGNSVIVTNDDLAVWIRRDFPDYRIEASVIKNINSYEKIDRAMELYDTVILPMSINRDHGFLAGIQQKERITLFANAGCALTCTSKICYASISRLNKFKGGKFRCSQPIKPRTIMGMIDFDLDELLQLGFFRFKLLRARPGDVSKVTGY
jgi:hypothetical protein